jgi:hypothetical protein
MALRVKYQLSGVLSPHKSKGEDYAREIKFVQARDSGGAEVGWLYFSFSLVAFSTNSSRAEF